MTPWRWDETRSGASVPRPPGMSTARAGRCDSSSGGRRGPAGVVRRVGSVPQQNPFYVVSPDVTARSAWRYSSDRLITAACRSGIPWEGARRSGTGWLHPIGATVGLWERRRKWGYVSRVGVTGLTASNALATVSTRGSGAQ